MLAVGAIGISAVAMADSIGAGAKSDVEVGVTVERLAAGVDGRLG